MDIRQSTYILLAGATAGAAVALLLASRYNDKRPLHNLDTLHENLRLDVTDWVDGIADVLRDGAERGKVLSAEGYKQILQGFETASKCLEDGRNQMEQLINTV